MIRKSRFERLRWLQTGNIKPIRRVVVIFHYLLDVWIVPRTTLKGPAQEESHHYSIGRAEVSGARKNRRRNWGGSREEAAAERPGAVNNTVAAPPPRRRGEPMILGLVRDKKYEGLRTEWRGPEISSVVVLDR